MLDFIRRIVGKELKLNGKTVRGIVETTAEASTDTLITSAGVASELSGNYVQKQTEGQATGFFDNSVRSGLQSIKPAQVSELGVDDLGSNSRVRIQSYDAQASTYSYRIDVDSGKLELRGTTNPGATLTITLDSARGVVFGGQSDSQNFGTAFEYVLPLESPPQDGSDYVIVWNNGTPSWRMLP